MYTAKVSIEIIKQIEKKIDNIIGDIREKSRKLLTTCNTYQEACEKLDKYINSCCDAEIRSISSSIYFDLYAQFSESRLFSNPSLVNEFYSIDMRNYLNDNCKFEVNSGFAYSSKSRKKYALLVSAGIAVVGSLMSLGLTLPIGIIPSIIVGGVAYPVTYRIVQTRNIEDYLVDVEIYLKGLKTNFLSWIDNFETCYSKTIDDLVKKVTEK